ncbi:methyl farnesoate epoxidase-like [Ceratina calcarata]|uniref:Methyl farnesoate epoxidase-like n=1 Tax=Ceratina calcarata TaxID=156304 RepID=A0AAJ7J6I5_9HYME|nr:methyl farnesoate epoxidase-like [Ceratina calcarata]
MFATVLLVLLTLILFSISLLLGQKSKKDPPGPIPWPFFGNQILLKRLKRELGAQHAVFMELGKRYDSDVISVHLGNDKVLVVNGFKLITTVMKSDDYDGRPWNEFIKIRNMGKKSGITMNDGTEWKELRGWMVRTMKFFGLGKSEMSEMLKNELLNMVENLKTKGGPRKMKSLITPAVVNVLWYLATGTPFLDGKKLQFFSDLLETRSKAFDMAGGWLSTFPWIRYIAPESSGYNVLMTLNNELRNFLLESIREHKKNYKPGSEADLIDMFLHEMEDHTEYDTVYTEEQLVIILVDLFIAGCTTTGTTVDFLFLHMAVHQDVQRKLQKEIDSVIPRDRIPDLDDRPKLPYVEAVMSESQRLWPVFPIVGPRRVLRDTDLDKYTIPKESTVLMNSFSISRDPNLYTDPEKFIPERYIKNGAFVPDPYSLQFGKGRRRCPGEALAKAASFILFVGVMQKFNILPVPGKGPTTIEVTFGITTSPKPYEILAVPR